jgi:xanthine dehydrogenase/oxidase
LDTAKSFGDDANADELRSPLSVAEVGSVDVSGENNFPAELDDCSTTASTFKGQGLTWHRAASVTDALRMLSDDNARIVGSNTSVGIYKSQPESVLVAVSHLPELSVISADDNGVSFGAICTLTALQHELQKQIGSKVQPCGTFFHQFELTFLCVPSPSSPSHPKRWPPSPLLLTTSSRSLDGVCGM